LGTILLRRRRRRRVRARDISPSALFAVFLRRQ